MRFLIPYILGLVVGVCIMTYKFTANNYEINSCLIYKSNSNYIVKIKNKLKYGIIVKNIFDGAEEYINNSNLDQYTISDCLKD